MRARSKPRSLLLVFQPPLATALLACAFTLGLFAFLSLSAASAAAQQASPNPAQTEPQASPNGSAQAPRGIKLILTDGSSQRVREYKVIGDRVRFYSMDRSDWEEIPASLVDWAATKKAEAAHAQVDAALVKKARHQENQRRIMPLEIDASLEIYPGVFLPPGQGVWVLAHKDVLQLPPAEPIYKLNKRHEIAKILSPIPIVSERHTILIKGAHAKLRIRSANPEFYLRVSADTVPSLELVRAQVEGSHRKIAQVDQLFKMENATTHPLLMQRWQMAKDVYRFTLGQSLPPGEYALVEVVPGETQLDQLSLFVWDFGVDAPGETEAKEK